MNRASTAHRIGTMLAGCALALLVAAATGCTSRDADDAIFSAQLSEGAPRKLGKVELEKDASYEVLIVAEGIPKHDHKWRARVKGRLQKRGGVRTFDGSPKRYLDRDTDGDGRSYWSHLVIAKATVPAGGTWEVWVDELEYLPPTGGSVTLQVHRERGPLERVNWWLMPFLGGGLGLLGYGAYRLTTGTRDISSGGGGSSFFVGGGGSCGSSCGGGGCGGGGCGGGCGGCS